MVRNLNAVFSVTVMEKMKGRCKQYNEGLYRRDKRKSDSFEQESYDEELTVLESEVKAVRKALEGKKLSEVDGILMELFQEKWQKWKIKYSWSAGNQSHLAKSSRQAHERSIGGSRGKVQEQRPPSY